MTVPGLTKFSWFRFVLLWSFSYFVPSFHGLVTLQSFVNRFGRDVT